MKEIRKTTVVTKHHKHCFEMWTNENRISGFFAPQCRVELKIGGAFEMYFLLDAPEGQRGSEGCKVLSFVPNEMLSFSWNAPPQFPNIRNGGHHTWVVINFHPIETNKTKVVLHHLGWREGGRWNEVYDYFDAAWSRVLENFKQACSD